MFRRFREWMRWRKAVVRDSGRGTLVRVQITASYGPKPEDVVGSSLHLFSDGGALTSPAAIGSWLIRGGCL
jgi:hypothetical protein